MKKIIIILGDIASGKSTLADAIQAETGFLCFQKDKVKEALCDEIGFSNREENLRLSRRAIDLMFATSEVAMNLETGILLEANFHSDELKRLQKLIEKYQYQSFFIHLTGELEFLYKRFLARVPTRHKSHLSIGLHKDYSAFYRYVISSREDIKDWFFPHTYDVTSMTSESLFQEIKKVLTKEKFLCQKA